MAFSASNLPGIIIVEESARLVSVYRRFFALAGLPIAKIFNNVDELLEFFSSLRSGQQSHSIFENSIILLRDQIGGIETAAKLKAINSKPRIILVTNDLDSIPAPPQKQYEAVLEKPFLMTDLFRTIERVTSSLGTVRGSRLFEGPEEVLSLIKEILSDDISRVCLCLDSNTAVDFLSVATPLLSKALSEGVHVSLITDISTENIQFWKGSFLIDKGMEIRHIKGIKTNSIAVDRKHYLLVVSSVEGVIQRVMYSNSESILSRERYLFDSLWKRSDGLQRRLRELEESPRPEKKLEIFHGDADYMIDRVNLVREARRFLDVCYEHDFAKQLLWTALREEYQSAIRRGVKIRHITEIRSDNIAIVKDLMKMGVEVHHLAEVKGGFAVNETSMTCTAANHGSETLGIDYRFPLLIQQAQWMFDSLWKSSSPAEIIIDRSSQGNTSSSSLDKSIS